MFAGARLGLNGVEPVVCRPSRCNSVNPVCGTYLVRRLASSRTMFVDDEARNLVSYVVGCANANAAGAGAGGWALMAQTPRSDCVATHCLSADVES